MNLASHCSVETQGYEAEPQSDQSKQQRLKETLPPISDRYI